MGLKLISAPTFDPITLTQAKMHLRQIDNDEDDLIELLITAATRNVENWTGRALCDQTWELQLDAFPVNEIQIPKPPLIEVVSVRYDDPEGVEQILSTTDYTVDNVSEPGWVVLNTTASWPTILEAVKSVRVGYRAGYPDSDSPPSGSAIPFDIKAAIFLLLGTLYEHREQVQVGAIPYQLPWGVQNLLRPHRVLKGMA